MDSVYKCAGVITGIFPAAGDALLLWGKWGGIARSGLREMWMLMSNIFWGYPKPLSHITGGSCPLMQPPSPLVILNPFPSQTTFHTRSVSAADPNMKASDLPSFADMPAVQGMPHGCAWGLWDVQGKRDNLGTLNLLTPEVVLHAKDEIRTGESVSVNWPIDRLREPGFGRRAPEHHFIDLKPSSGHPVHDDEIHINVGRRKRSWF